MRTVTNFRIDENTRRDFHIWCIQTSSGILRVAGAVIWIVLGYFVVAGIIEAIGLTEHLYRTLGEIFDR